ncbi:N-acyl amino acid synthase FeeM domain-containing protein [Wukongibacter sp. M2B1]|uniref:N-acyl amino acid synthase FeeM domain-containing protein n=1 Tax=Wukongibacter sp. M2B1 TaxID=3088895 RepID=UPI003D7B1514
MKLVKDKEGFVFAIADTEAEYQSIYKLRYDIYICEMNRRQSSANHELAIIEEDIDKYSTLLMVFHNNELIGSSRITIHQDFSCDLAKYYGMKKIEKVSNSLMSEGSKLMIKKEYRGHDSNLGRYMVQYGYQVLREKNVAFDFLNANEYLVNYYMSYGYRICGQSFIHPELLDKVYPMILVTEDIDYLESINSPLLEVARLYSNEVDTLELAKNILAI